MAFVQGINDIRNVTWSSKYLWDIRFPSTGTSAGAPYPFDKWFPALDIEEDAAVIENYTFSIGHTQMSIPHKTSQKQIKITFVDDSKNVLFNWFSSWINSTVNRSNGTVATVKEAARQLQIIKLDRDRTTLDSKVYWVILLMKSYLKKSEVV